MRTFLATAVLALFLAPAAFAIGGDFNDTPQQQMASQGKIVVNVPPAPPSDNTGVWVAGGATIVAAGVAAYVGNRRRKR